MVNASLFDFKISGTIVERLNLITIVLPADVAQKQERLRAAGLVHEEIEGLEKEVSLLTNYLIQKSYISTIRSLVKAIQFANRLEREGRPEQRQRFISALQDFLVDLYSYRVDGPENGPIQDSGSEVLKLFEEICSKVFNSESGLSDEKLPAFLAAKQREYVRIVLERSRQITTTFEGIAASRAASERVDALLNKMESDNLEWLIETFSVPLDATPGKQRLPELDNNTQKNISNAVLTRMNASLSEFNEATQNGQQSGPTMWRLPFVGRKKTIDLSQTGLLEAEQFVVELRLAVSYRQQITYLGSVLDKVNHLASMLNQIEARVNSADRLDDAKSSKAVLQERKSRYEALSQSGDPLDAAIGEFGLGAQLPLEADSHLFDILAKQDHELANEISKFKNLFAQKTQIANDVLAILVDMGNQIRVLGPMVILEAQQKNAPFTTQLIQIISEGSKRIQDREGGGQPVMGILNR